jgi:hypothetical protein
LLGHPESVLERVARANLRHAKIALDLSEVVEVAGKGLGSQSRIGSDAIVRKAGLVLGIGCVEGVPTKLQLMTVTPRHLPGFSQA